jgi:hypothetical protein
VEEEEKGGGCSTVGCSLYSRQRWNEGGVVVEPWAANNGDGRGWDIVSAVWASMFGL